MQIRSSIRPIDPTDLAVLKGLQELTTSLYENMVELQTHEFLLEDFKSKIREEFKQMEVDREAITKQITEKYGEGKIDLEKGTIELFQ